MHALLKPYGDTLKEPTYTNQSLKEIFIPVIQKKASSYQKHVEPQTHCKKIENVLWKTVIPRAPSDVEMHDR